MFSTGLRRRVLPLLLLAATGLMGGCAYYDPYTGTYVPYGTYSYGYGYPAYAYGYGYSAPVVSGSVVVGGGSCWNCGWGWRRPYWGWRGGYWGWRRW
jgi:hypothetical protein